MKKSTMVGFLLLNIVLLVAFISHSINHMVGKLIYQVGVPSVPSTQVFFWLLLSGVVVGLFSGWLWEKEAEQEFGLISSLLLVGPAVIAPLIYWKFQIGWVGVVYGSTPRIPIEDGPWLTNQYIPGIPVFVPIYLVAVIFAFALSVWLFSTARKS